MSNCNKGNITSNNEHLKITDSVPFLVHAQKAEASIIVRNNNRSLLSNSDRSQILQMAHLKYSKVNIMRLLVHLECNFELALDSGYLFLYSRKHLEQVTDLTNGSCTTIS